MADGSAATDRLREGSLHAPAKGVGGSGCPRASRWASGPPCLYLRASGKLEPALARLERLAATDPQEKAEHERLLPRLEVFRAESSKALALADAGEIPAARRLRERGEGAKAADQAKESVDRLEIHEEREVELQQLLAGS